VEPDAVERQSASNVSHPRQRAVGCRRAPFLSVVTIAAAAAAAQDEPALRAPSGHAHHAHPVAPSPVQVGFGLSVAAGGSTARDEQLRELQGGAHDPRARGFTLQQAVLALGAEIEPWLLARAHLVASIDPQDGATEVEIEEAYALATGLPGSLEAKAGTFFTEFGLANPRHPHEWAWLDQPFVHTRLFGGEGLRGPGARLAWRPAGDAFELLGTLQNGNGETMVSFLANEEVYEERPIGGRAFAAADVRSGSDLVTSLRAAARFVLATDLELRVGASGSTGPNATGDDARTFLWGADVALALRDANGSEPWLLVEIEGTARAFEAAAQQTPGPVIGPALPPTTLDDVGGYAQVLYGCGGPWAVGLRGEHATGSGDSYLGGGAFGRAEDPFRCDRWRVSPLLTWRPSPAARLRLQYSWDDSEHLGREEHSLWLGFDVWFGPHAHGR
jgi:hypothetical protein